MESSPSTSSLTADSALSVADTQGHDGKPAETSVVKPRRRRSFTQSIRARLSRSSSSGSRPSSSASSSTSSLPPVPPVPRNYSTNATSLSASASMPSLATPTSPPSSSTAQVTEEDLEQAWQSITPPSFPSAPQYTSCYCEENIFHLTRHLSSQLSAVNQAAVNIARRQQASRRSRSPAPPAAGSNAVFVPVWDLEVVFISNPGKTVLLYQQRASKLPIAGSCVIWDYHVVAVASCHLIPLGDLSLCGSSIRTSEGEGEKWTRSWVYDFDTLLSPPEQPYRAIPWTEYTLLTFRPEAIRSGVIPEHFQPSFRSVPANDFLDHFASDRGHMRHNPPREDGVEWHSPPPTWDLVVGEVARKEGVRNNLMERYVDVTVREEGRYGRVWDAIDWLEGRWVHRGRRVGGTIGKVDRDSASTKDVGLGNERGQEAHVDDQVHRTCSAVRERTPTMTTKEPQIEGEGERERQGRTGGRIASPLFPAYLHASQQHRSRPSSAPTT